MSINICKYEQIRFMLIQIFLSKNQNYDFPDACTFIDGYISGKYEIIGNAQNASECALLAKHSNEFATGASFKNVSCEATYGNHISDDGPYISCIFPGNCYLSLSLAV